MQINAHIDDIIDNDIIDMVIKHAIPAWPHDFPPQPPPQLAYQVY